MKHERDHVEPRTCVPASEREQWSEHLREIRSALEASHEKNEGFMIDGSTRRSLRVQSKSDRTSYATLTPVKVSMPLTLRGYRDSFSTQRGGTARLYQPERFF